MPPEPIIVTPEDIERTGHAGRHSIYRYRRFRIMTLDAWGVVVYSQILEYSRDVPTYVARVLELKLLGLHEGAARIWIAENTPIWIPSGEDDASIATLANPLPPI